MIKSSVTLALGLALAMTGVCRAASVGMLGVEVTNHSEAQLCAEKDNVALMMAAPNVKQFRIEAAHPSYMGALGQDRFAPDWTACDIKPDFGTAGQYVPPQRQTIYEDTEIALIGYRYPGFWRDRSVPVRVGDRVETGYQLLQVWVRGNERNEEVLVLYPPDGYWRARPLPPQHLGWSAYGSSFLLGPIEDVLAKDGAPRPVVDITDIAFDPKARAFTLQFARGGSAKLTMTKLDRERQRLDIVFDAPITGRPFAALRSMYVTEFNNDVAQVAILETGAKSWREEPIMATTGAKSATDVWAGRVVPSRHNTSSPDTVFEAFSDGTMTPPEWLAPWPKKD